MFTLCLRCSSCSASLLAPVFKEVIFLGPLHIRNSAAL
uniref:Uncharacterized protein n=1 Tax=Rhizophora mucronata TaxID=61149 RepID=A0A2P2KYB3_RHIMU